MANIQLSVVEGTIIDLGLSIPGVQGSPGQGIPSGGTANQVLVKTSSANYVTEWSEVTKAMLGGLEIVNADIATNAAIADTKLATISTAGKISNNATTANSANTALTIVARDNNGNFSAGTITANLTGNASTVTTNANLTGDVTSVGNATAIAAGVIVNADINASAEIAVSKLADGSARQLLQTDAAGTGVEWASNIDIPGTLDVTSAATFDAAVTIQGDLTVNGTTTTIDTANLAVEDKNIEIGKVTTPSDVTADGGGITLKGTTDKTINWIDATDAWTLSEHVNIVSTKEYRIAGTKVLDATSLGSGVTGSSLTSVGTISSGTWQGTAISKTYLDATLVSTGDTGTVTSTMILDGTIVNGDINASAAILDTKLATIATAGKVSNSATTATDANTANAIVARDASGNFSAGTITANLTGTASAIADNTVTSAKIVDGTIVDVDINASAEIAVSKLADGSARQLLQTDSAGTGVEWTNNVDVPGTLDVTGATTLDSTLSVPLGTAALPSIYPGTDTNTGIYSPGADQVAISTNGTGRLFVDASGNVGVGTSSPASLIHVDSGIITTGRYGSSGAIVLRSAAGTQGAPTAISTSTNISAIACRGYDGSAYRDIASIGVNSDGAISSVSSPGYIIFNTTSSGSTTVTERARLTSDGRLGLGTSSPGTLGGGAILNISPTGGGRIVIGSPNRYFYITGASGTEDLRFGRRISSDTADNDIFTINGSTGNVGIGTTSPDALLTVNGIGAFGAGAVTTPSIAATGDLNTGFWFPAADTIAASTGGSERARIDSSGRLLVGTSTSYALGGGDRRLQVHGANASDAAIGVTRWSADSAAPRLLFGKARGSLGAFTAVIDGDNLGAIEFLGANGTDLSNVGASIAAFVDGDPFTSGDTTDLPSRLVFSTTADGAASPTEALRITNDRVIAYNQPAPTSKSAAATLTITELKTGIIEYTGAVATLTLPTGTLMEGGFSGIYTNMAFEWSVINTGTGICTIGAGTAHTIVGSATVAIGASARFVSRRTASNTFVSYRLS